MDHHEADQTQAVDRYCLGEMTEAERLAFEEHYFDCEECAAGVEMGAVLAANAIAVFSEEDRAGRSRRGLAWFTWRWPAVAFAGLFLGVAFEEVVRVPALQTEVAAKRAPESYPVFFLHSVARSGGQVVTIPARSAYAGMSLDVPPGKAFSTYECRLENPAGDLVWSVTAAAPAPGNPVNILLPVSSIPTGRYTLVLSGREGRSPTELQRISFTVQIK